MPRFYLFFFLPSIFGNFQDTVNGEFFVIGNFQDTVNIYFIRVRYTMLKDVGFPLTMMYNSGLSKAVSSLLERFT